jgi:putative copper resistance protein D
MQALANFLSMLLDVLLFVAYAGTMGGLVWSLQLGGPWGKNSPAEQEVMHRSMALWRWSALGMAVAQLAQVAMQAWLLAEAFQRSPLPAYFGTLPFQAGLTRASLAGATALAGWWAGRRRKGLLLWSLIGFLAVLLGASGAWLSHAVARGEARLWLMSLTALHQLGMAVWLGGVILLGLFWRMTRQRSELRHLWPKLLRSFAWIGGAAMLGLAATGLSLAWTYIGTWQGLIGTDYGSMVLIKVALLVATLSFAALNFRAARTRPAQASNGASFQRSPSYVEAETLLLLAILFAAVSLSSQPPAIDLNDQHATWAELYEVFRPKMPQLTSPSYAEAVAAFTGRASGAEGIRVGVGTRWSDYNHNVSGLFLAITALLALASQARWLSWARHWPLGFVALSLFVVLRSDAEDSWPFGRLGFWEGVLSSDEIFLHRLGALIACALGLMEWRVRVKSQTRSYLAYVTPVLCAVGGLFLLGHPHAGLQPKEEFLIQITHSVVGLLAVTMACGRWLELRLTPPVGRLAGLASVSALLIIGLILLFYRETPIP